MNQLNNNITNEREKMHTQSTFTDNKTMVRSVSADKHISKLNNMFVFVNLCAEALSLNSYINFSIGLNFNTSCVLWSGVNCEKLFTFETFYNDFVIILTSYSR